MSEIFNPNIDIVQLANATVYTEQGKKIRLGQTWQKKPVIFIFLRHFACIACRAHAIEVWQDREKYQKNGHLIFVGNGSSEYISIFKEELKIKEAVVLTDPSLESFRAAGFHYGFFYVAQPNSIKNVIRMVKKGHKQVSYKKQAGTHWQLGGILGVNQSGQVFYQYISESMGDFPNEPHFEKIVADEKKRLTPDSDNP